MYLPLSRISLCTLVASAMLFAVPASPAQEAAVTTSPVSVVPHLIKFSGALPGAPGKTNVVDVKFSLYAAQTGGEALWSETQQVSLDSAGKYSVLLGSSVALPDSAFANGQARWIGVTLGGEQESARTVLVATPYSLKASDSETLGGHPASDFIQKNAQPASGTNITQINVGNGVTGGGTGPTVTLGLSNSYLETLGNGIYPQLHGTNTLTGKNTYTAGDLLLGTSPVVSTTTVLGSSPVTATVSGNTVKIGLSDSALLTLGNGVYAQLTAANTFTKTQTMNGFLTINSRSSCVGAFTGYYSCYAANTGTTALNGGFEGEGYNQGLYGVAEDATSGEESDGVIGESASPTGAGVIGIETNLTTSAAGVNGTMYQASAAGAAIMPGILGAAVWGDSGAPTGDQSAILGTTDNGNAGLFLANNSDYYTVFILNQASGGYPFEASNSADGGVCSMDSIGDFSCTGTIGNVVHAKASNRDLTTHSVSSPENWIEDFGSGQLSGGVLHVAIEPNFREVVNTGTEYHVFLTPEGDCKGLYIASKGSNGFDVRELGGGTSNVTFSYRIVVKRSGMETARLEDVTARNPSKMVGAESKPSGRTLPKTAPAPRAMPHRLGTVPIALNQPVTNPTTK